jgi:HAD superfamily hydrolase (TIGR01459 family)
MTRIIDRFSDISTNYDALFCDLWGCLHDGLRPFPDAVAALVAFREGGGRVALVTNSPRPSDGVIAQLQAMGVPREAYDVVVSSGDAAQAAMVAGMVGTRVWRLGPEKDLPFFTHLPDGTAITTIETVDFDDAEGIVCTGPFDDADHPEAYRATFLAAKARGLKLLCANPDIIVDQGETRMYCAGALAALYTEMGGESLYFGKPHAPIYQLARQRLSEIGEAAENERILAVGDGIATDVLGALQENVDALFISGGIAAEETGTTDSPDPARLKTFLEAHGQSPAYAIGFLR